MSAMDILRNAEAATGNTISQGGRVAKSATDWLGSEFGGGASFTDQREVWILFVSEYAKALYESGINEYASRITRDCATEEGSSAQCFATGSLNLGLGGLNAANPLFYIKQVFMTCVTVLLKEGLLTDLEAIRYRNAFEIAFALADLAQICNLVNGLTKNAGELGSVRITNSGNLDGRFHAVKEMTRLLQEALQSTIETTGAKVAEKR